MAIKSLILETIVESAYTSLNKLSTTHAFDEAFEMVAEDFNLTAEERAALAERAKKAPKTVGNSDVSEDLVGGDMTTEPGMDCAGDCAAGQNSLYFGSEDDLDQATGILMYKGIPWKTKNKEGGQFLIEFDNQETLQEAQAVLKRRYDFVESTPRRVGVVEFDNLSDYSKVLEYMKRQGMMIECNEGATLDEDAEIQEAVSVEQGGENPGLSRSFNALSKSGESVNLDVFENMAARSVTVRKRWK